MIKVTFNSLACARQASRDARGFSFTNLVPQCADRVFTRSITSSASR